MAGEDWNWDPWSYREGTDVTRPGGIVGFGVRANDGDIGTIDEATMDVGSSYVVVDTGGWIFGRKVLLPAGTIQRVDWDEKVVHVDRTKAEIKDSPELGGGGSGDHEYRDLVAQYYGDTYLRRGIGI